MAKAPTLKDIPTGGAASANALNANNDAIQAAFENTLSRDGSSPNQMETDLDMNGYNILNVGEITTGGSGTLPTQAQLGEILYPRSSEEVTAGVTPTLYNYPVGDIRRYGAVGDFSTDCTQAIQDACDVMGVLGGTVIIPGPGSYLVTSNIDVPVGWTTAVSIRGENWTAGAVIKFSGAAVTKGFNFDGVSDYEYAGSIEDLRIDLINLAARGVTWNYLNHPRMVRCTIYGAESQAVWINNVLLNHIENCLFMSCGKDGVSAYVEVDATVATSTVGYWAHNRISNGQTNAVCGLKIDRMQDYEIIGGNIESSVQADSFIPIKIGSEVEPTQYCKNINIRGVDIEHPGTHYIEIGMGWSGSAGAAASQCMIEGIKGSISGGTDIRWGVKIKDTNAIEFRNNQFPLAGGTQTCEYWLEGTGNNGTVIRANRARYGASYPWVMVNGSQQDSAGPQADWFYSNRGQINYEKTATDADTTPSIMFHTTQGGIVNRLVFANTGATTVTKFLTAHGDTSGMRLVVRTTNANTTLSQKTGSTFGMINLRSGRSLTLQPGRLYEFQSDGTLWHEVTTESDHGTLDLASFGLSTANSGAANRAAIEAAIVVAKAMGGATLQAPPGTFTIDATVTIDGGSIIIKGAGARVTYWRFDPASPDVLFDFTAGASILYFSGIKDCSFYSANSVNKTAVQATDVNNFTFENITIATGGWDGSGSIGLYVKGRDSLNCCRSLMNCARPVVFGVNPNYATLHMDHFRIEDCEFGTTLSTGKSIEVEDGVCFSNTTFNRLALTGGKYSFYWNDTTAPASSFKLMFSNIRCEQNADGTGYWFWLNEAGANYLQDVVFSNVYTGHSKHGYYLRRTQRIIFDNCTLVDATVTGKTQIDADLITNGHLALRNTLISATGVVTLTNHVLSYEEPYATGTYAISPTCNYVYSSLVNGTIPTFRIGAGVAKTAEDTWFTNTYLGVQNANPHLYLYQTGEPADEKLWSFDLSSGNFQLATRTDAQLTGKVAMSVLRGTGTAVSTITFGNATDNPAISFPGTGTATFGGVVSLSSTAPALRIYESDGTADEKNWTMIASGDTWYLRTYTDLAASPKDIMSVTRTGTTVDTLTFGNATDNPIYTFSGTSDVKVNGDLVVPKTSAVGIKVDTTTPTFGWRDIIGTVSPKTTGAGAPTRAVYAGGNIADYAFILNDLCDFVFHIPHDYVPGTDLYFHVHWSHTDAVSITGNASFTIYHSYAKGHNQANFSAEKNFVITHATTDLTTTPQYRHRIDEAQLSTSGGSASLLDTAAIEVDGLVIVTLKLSALPTFGGTGKLFIHTCDLHYQSTNVGTKAKVGPSFYT